MVLDDHGFRKLLAAEYQKIRASGSKPRLVNPTRGGIRTACLERYDSGVEARDQPVLEAFFGIPRNTQTLRTRIADYGLDGFRAFQNYLNDNSIDTDDINVNLLAWLINFPHRPNRINNQVLLSDEEKGILGISSAPGGTNPPAPAPPEDSRTKPGDTGQPSNTNEPEPTKVKTMKTLPRWVKRGAVVLGIGVAAVAVYSIVDPPEKCMYWTGDHYEKVRCGEEPNGRLIIQINPAELDMKRITREDSIKEQHIDKLFYIKKNNDIQYFTKGGRYPEDLKRDLQELSRHIFDKDSSERRLNSNNKP